MWCRLQWFWSRACYCCSAWHWSAVAGTSPSDAPQDQPGLVRYSSLWRPVRGEKYDCTFSRCYDDCCAYCVCVLDREKQLKREKGGFVLIPSEFVLSTFISFHGCCVLCWCVFDLTHFTLLGCRGCSWTRTQT